MSLHTLAREIASALDRGHLDGAVRETAVFQPDHSAYGDTHLALLFILLGRLGGDPQADFASADRRLALWEPLGVEEPFNAFALALALLLAREAVPAHPVVQRLERLNRSQRLTAAQTRLSRSGNNIYVMHCVAEMLLRPLALGTRPEPGALTDLLTRIGSFALPEGIHSDWPRDQSGPRIVPPAYALKFTYLLAVVYIFTGDARFHDAFAESAEVLLGVATDDGVVASFGRSENSTFALGLEIFATRILRASGGGAWLDGLLAAQQARLAAMPRTAGGWFEVNGGFPSTAHAHDRILARDSYAMPTEYAAASLCYCLMSELLAPRVTVRTKPTPERRPEAHSDGLGVARLSRPAAEVLVRTRSDLVEDNRRYGGPTVLRFRVGDDLLVGAIPVLSEGEDNVVTAWQRLYDLIRRGAPETRYLTVGYVPIVSWRGRTLLPLHTIDVALSRNAVQTSHGFVPPPVGRLGAALGFVSDLARKNLGWPSAHISPHLRPIPAPVHGLRLTRQVMLSDATLEILDKIDGLHVGAGIRIAGRISTVADLAVTGLEISGESFGWSSNGRACLTTWTGRATGPEVTYSFRIRPRP